MYKLLSRKLMGENYRSAVKTLFVAAIIAVSLSSMEIKIPLAQSVLILTGMMYSGAIVFMTMSSQDNARCLKGLFAMPCDEKKTLWGYAGAVGLYVLLTKTSLLAALLFALTKVSVMSAVLFLLSFVYALFGGMTAYSYMRRMPLVSALIVISGVLMAFFLPGGIIAAAVLAAADLIMAVLYAVQPFESFYVTSNSSLKVKVKKGKPKALLLRYITRYLLENKNYIISSVVIVAFGCVLSINSEKQGLAFGCGLGLSMISMNTPMAIIVSSNRGLKQKLDVLPDKTRNFFVPYALVVFGFYVIVNTVFLTVFGLFGGNVGIKGILTALLFAVESSVYTAFIEDRFTITKWNTEQDLWHNPRKYILPVALLLQASLIYLNDIIANH